MTRDTTLIIAAIAFLSSAAPATSQPPVTFESPCVGKAFFDIGHSLKDQRSNRRSHLPGYAAWEIHPVMKLDVQ